MEFHRDITSHAKLKVVLLREQSILIRETQDIWAKNPETWLKILTNFRLAAARTISSEFWSAFCQPQPRSDSINGWTWSMNTSLLTCDITATITSHNPAYFTSQLVTVKATETKLQMNRDERSYQLSHIYDNLFAPNLSGEQLLDGSFRRRHPSRPKHQL